MEEKKKGFFGEFREFISRGNVLDMAVGVIIASAFGKISTSLVNDVFMPFIGWLFGGMDLSQLNITLREAVMDGENVVSEAVVIGIGTFISTIIDFIVIAFVVFLIVKAFNKARDLTAKKTEEAEAEEEAEPEDPKPTTEELLAQILEEMKAKK